MNYTANISTPERQFLPKTFEITDWKSLEPYFKDLLDREIPSKQDLVKWMKDASELEAVVSGVRAVRDVVGAKSVGIGIEVTGWSVVMLRVFDCGATIVP